MSFTEEQLQKAFTENKLLFELETQKLESMSKEDKEFKSQLALCSLLQNENFKLQKKLNETGEKE